MTARFHELAPLDARAAKSKHEKTVDRFSEQALTLLQSLMEMEAFLREIMPKYCQPKRFIRVKGARMSEREKDEFDADIMELVKNCSTKIDVLKDMTELASRGKPSMLVEHQKEIVTYFLERLKSITNATKRLQKRRYAQPFLLSPRLLPEEERTELEKLEKQLPKANGKKSVTKPIQKSSMSDASPSACLDVDDKSSSKKIPHEPHPRRDIQQIPIFSSTDEEIEFTEEENQRFRVENVMLHRHFQENLEDVKQMESKMAEISNLMGQFADKIMEQQTDIELIHQHAQETKSNISQSNDILEHTKRIGTGYGFMIFCFYLGFSILLHMLHYFHD